MDMNNFAVDLDRFEDGATLMLSETSGVKMRSTGSDKAQKVRERLYEPYSGFREIPDDISLRLTCDWIAQGLVVEWIGDDWTLDGKSLDTADQKAMSKALQDKRLKPLRDKLFGFAINEKNFRDRQEAEAEKNSEPGPNGGSAGAKTPKA